MESKPNNDDEVNNKNVEDYFKQREELVQKDKKDYFWVDVTELTEEELKADQKLEELKNKILEGDNVPFLQHYYESKPIIENSEMYKALVKMPKGGNLHYHLTAAAPLELLMELTKEDIVYYHQKNNVISVFPNGNPEEGYTQCNLIRDNWNKEKTFDDFIKSKILLTQHELDSKHSTSIWKEFQYKFSLCLHLYNYHKFFRRILTAVLNNAIEEKVYAVELKHIFGCVINDNREIIDFKDEVKIFQECIEEAQKIEPLLSVKLIVCGLKIAGEGHVSQQLDFCSKGLVDYPDLIVGYDLVNEEDTTPPLKSFRSIVEAAKKENPKMDMFFHAGESSSRFNFNLYDAILLDTKRIGHGFAIINHPYLTDLVKEKQVCLEICPLSNLILGYTFDLRWHPARSLMHRGVPLTLGADDPGFWATKGVSLDYAYVTLAWELGIKELKQFAINGIKYSSIKDTSEHMKRFNEEWDKWISELIQ